LSDINSVALIVRAALQLLQRNKWWDSIERAKASWKQKKVSDSVNSTSVCFCDSLHRNGLAPCKPSSTNARSLERFVAQDECMSKFIRRLSVSFLFLSVAL